MPRIYIREQGRPTLRTCWESVTLACQFWPTGHSRLKSQEKTIILEGARLHDVPTPLGKVTSSSWFAWGCPSFSTVSFVSREILQSWVNWESPAPYPWGKVLALPFHIKTRIRGFEGPLWSHGPGTQLTPMHQTPRGPRARSCRSLRVYPRMVRNPASAYGGWRPMLGERRSWRRGFF